MSELVRDVVRARAGAGAPDVPDWRLSLLNRRAALERLRAIEAALEDLAQRKLDEHGEKRRAVELELDLIDIELEGG